MELQNLMQQQWPLNEGRVVKGRLSSLGALLGTEIVQSSPFLQENCQKLPSSVYIRVQVELSAIGLCGYQ